MTAPRAAPRRSPAAPARGAALLVVIVSIAILTAIAVDLAYSTRVSLLAAANGRDELRAEYLARGATQLSRLVLNLQTRLDGTSLPGGGGVRLRIFDLVPVSRAMTDGLFGAGEGEGEAGPAGSFGARIEDEGTKVNVQFDAPETGGVLAFQVRAFLAAVGDPRWDPLFDREDANGLRVTRPDLAVYLHDWTDPDSVGSAISDNRDRPFEDGFGDENQPYDRGDEPYQAKNARFDSVEELLMVAGFDDAVMEAFGSQLTVYLDKNSGLNSNTLDPLELLRNAVVMADPPGQAKLSDPNLPGELARLVGEARQGGVLSLPAAQYATIFASLGIQVNPTAAGAFTDRSLVYRIRATGTAGAAQRQVNAVVSFDKNQAPQEAALLGRLLHWREE